MSGRAPVTEEPTAIVYVDSSSSDAVYQCTRFGRRWECECPSHRLRGTCKHVGIAMVAASGTKVKRARVDFAR